MFPSIIAKTALETYYHDLYAGLNAVKDSLPFFLNNLYHKVKTS